MTKASFVVVSDVGDPTNPRTWSGTPSHLISALQRNGCEVTGLDITPARIVRGALSLLSWASVHGRQYRRTRLASAFYSLGKLKEIGDEGAVFLHMGTATIPLGTRNRDVRHVLFMDSTFHLMLSSPILKLSEMLCRRYDKFEREAIAAADHIFTVSECAKADIVDHYAISAERLTAVGTGMGSIQPTEGKKDYSACTTLFVAKQRFEEKGGLLLLEGFRLAQKENPRLKLIVVATEPYRYMTEQVPGATFKTALSWEALEAYFNEASLFAMPALYEPWGLVYVESLACRTPVLGMNRNALPELTQNGKYGFLLNDASPSSVAGALLDAFSNIEHLAEMGCGGQEYVQGRYTWDKVALRIVRALF